jgi:hypothetical protein
MCVLPCRSHRRSRITRKVRSSPSLQPRRKGPVSALCSRSVTARRMGERCPFAAVRAGIQKLAGLVAWTAGPLTPLKRLMAYAVFGRGMLSAQMPKVEEMPADDIRAQLPRFNSINARKTSDCGLLLEVIARGKNATLAQPSIAWPMA